MQWNFMLMIGIMCCLSVLWKRKQRNTRWRPKKFTCGEIMLISYEMSVLGQLHNVRRGRRNAICQSCDEERKSLFGCLEIMVQNRRLKEYGF